jgi:LCP family protein required for cell wall assembly
MCKSKKRKRAMRDKDRKDSDKNQNKPENTYDYQTHELLNDVRKSLSEQVKDTLDQEKSTKPEGEKEAREKKRAGKVLKYVVLPLILLLSAFVLLINTDYGRGLIIKLIGNYSYSKLNYVAPDQETSNSENTDQTGQGNSEKDRTKIKKISNILLIGMETFDGAENTDTMIVASIDSENKVIKLTSLMRDLYVKIPGHSNAKLNSAYAKGGIGELYATIEKNFGITLDGYALVDFNDFEQVIDYIGGIDVSLTQKEANYLNSTNYISNPAYRNVVAGTQHMNGNQVLGYCRVRKVPTETEHDDFGRTQRQRGVLEKIFEKMKSKNIIQLGIIMNNILSNINIKTDITKSEYKAYLQQAAYLKKSDIRTLRIPSDNNYTNESYSGLYVRDVLVPKSWEDTRKQIYDFIYGAQ